MQFYDHGEKFAIPNLTRPGQDILDDDQRHVEIWNLVFMQFEKDSKELILYLNPQSIRCWSRTHLCYHAGKILEL